ncbi:hypothetical protein ACIBSS_17570 [Micromonospora aurantiaca]|uniref:hypothetical protein n=1 Tax=Micromonospora aurantiaca (nom. illeg.) TaxID=47850 RepID=UPI0037998F95
MSAADEERREHIRRLVEEAPPLTQEQRATLGALLRPIQRPAPDAGQAPDLGRAA